MDKNMHFCGLFALVLACTSWNAAEHIFRRQRERTVLSPWNQRPNSNLLGLNRQVPRNERQPFPDGGPGNVLSTGGSRQSGIPTISHNMGQLSAPLNFRISDIGVMPSAVGRTINTHSSNVAPLDQQRVWTNFIASSNRLRNSPSLNFRQINDVDPTGRRQLRNTNINVVSGFAVPQNIQAMPFDQPIQGRHWIPGRLIHIGANGEIFREHPRMEPRIMSPNNEVRPLFRLQSRNAGVVNPSSDTLQSQSNSAGRPTVGTAHEGSRTMHVVNTHILNSLDSSGVSTGIVSGGEVHTNTTMSIIDTSSIHGRKTVTGVNSMNKGTANRPVSGVSDTMGNGHSSAVNVISNEKTSIRNTTISSFATSESQNVDIMREASSGWSSSPQQVYPSLHTTTHASYVNSKDILATDTGRSAPVIASIFSNPSTHKLSGTTTMLEIAGATKRTLQPFQEQWEAFKKFMKMRQPSPAGSSSQNVLAFSSNTSSDASETTTQTTPSIPTVVSTTLTSTSHILPGTTTVAEPHETTVSTLQPFHHQWNLFEKFLKLRQPSPAGSSSQNVFTTPHTTTLAFTIKRGAAKITAMSKTPTSPNVPLTALTSTTHTLPNTTTVVEPSEATAYFLNPFRDQWKAFEEFMKIRETSRSGSVSQNNDSRALPSASLAPNPITDVPETTILSKTSPSAPALAPTLIPTTHTLGDTTTMAGAPVAMEPARQSFQEQWKAFENFMKMRHASPARNSENVATELYSSTLAPNEGEASTTTSSSTTSTTSSSTTSTLAQAVALTILTPSTYQVPRTTTVLDAPEAIVPTSQEFLMQWEAFKKFMRMQQASPTGRSSQNVIPPQSSAILPPNDNREASTTTTTSSSTTSTTTPFVPLAIRTPTTNVGMGTTTVVGTLNPFREQWKAFQKFNDMQQHSPSGSSSSNAVTGIHTTTPRSTVNSEVMPETNLSAPTLPSMSLKQIGTTNAKGPNRHPFLDQWKALGFFLGMRGASPAEIVSQNGFGTLHHTALFANANSGSEATKPVLHAPPSATLLPSTTLATIVMDANGNKKATLDSLIQKLREILNLLD